MKHIKKFKDHLSEATFYKDGELFSDKTGSDDLIAKYNSNGEKEDVDKIKKSEKNRSIINRIKMEELHQNFDKYLHKTPDEFFSYLTQKIVNDENYMGAIRKQVSELYDENDPTEWELYREIAMELSMFLFDKIFQFEYGSIGPLDNPLNYDDAPGQMIFQEYSADEDIWMEKIKELIDYVLNN